MPKAKRKPCKNRFCKNTVSLDKAYCSTCYEQGHLVGPKRPLKDEDLKLLSLSLVQRPHFEQGR
jgi:hypothetical protein